MKTFLVLGGGADQIALIQELRNQVPECYIILVDYLENPVAKLYSDEHIKESTLDYEKVKKIASERYVDYVITACTDQALLTMAYVSECLKLPCYLSYDQALELTNKLYMKNKMMQFDIPTSKYICIDENYDISCLNGLNFPVVVKPVDSNSSKGVTKVNSIEEIRNAVSDAFLYSKTKNVIIEEFKEGEEISVDVYVEEENVKLLSVTTSRKVKQNKNNFTIVQSIYPCPFRIDENKILNIAKRIVSTFNLRNCPLLIQMIVQDNDYYVIEFSARMGGGSKYNLIKELSGVDIMKVYVEMFLGNDIHITPHKYYNYALMNYVYCNKGEYSRILNSENLLSDGIINDFFVYKSVHSFLNKSLNSSDRIAGFLIKGKTKEEISEKLKQANSRLKVLDVKGKDIMRHDVLEY